MNKNLDAEQGIKFVPATPLVNRMAWGLTVWATEYPPD
jgi:hypothetical protein